MIRIRLLGALMALALLGSLLRVPGASAQVADPDFPSVNGVVQAQLIVGDTLFVGGRFASIGGTRAGGFAVLDPATAQPVAPMPVVFGHVTAMAPDGRGGWYLGGQFTTVAGVPRRNLAHVRADGSLDAWDPGANSEILAMSRSGSTLYVGGYFTEVGGESRARLAALDLATGSVLPWDPAPNSGVFCLVASNTTLYVGGVFTTMNGIERSCAAAFDLASGTLTGWNPGADNVIRAIALAGERVYVGGDFGTVHAQVRGGYAAVDTLLGDVFDWYPGPVREPNYVFSLAASDSTLYVGGLFWGVNTTTCANLAALDAVTGEIKPWSAQANSTVRSLALRGGTLYAGGEFFTVGLQPRPGVAAIDAATGDVSAWNPSLGGVATGQAFVGTVRALGLQDDGDVVAGGEFNSTGAILRDRLAAIQLSTGTVLPWNPGANSDVNCLVAHDGVLYVSGDFIIVDQHLRGHLASFDIATGALTAWDPEANSVVRALVVRGDTVFAGGGFSQVGTQARARLAAIDAHTGGVLPWDPGADGNVYALAANDTTVFVGGQFTNAGGQPRLSIAAIDAATGEARAWNGAIDGYVKSLVLDGNSLYIGGFLGNAGGQTRKNAAALDATTGTALSWNPWVSGDVLALALADSSMVVGGFYANVSLPILPRYSLAVTETSSGAARPWDGLLGYQPEFAGVPYVYSLAVRGGSVFVGGDFMSLGGQRHSDLARILDSTTLPALAAGVIAPASGDAPSIGTHATLRWTASGGAPRVQSVDLWLSRSGSSGPWELLAAGVPNSGAYDWPVSGPVCEGSAILRVVARDFTGASLTADGDAFSVHNDLADVPGATARVGVALSAPAPNPVHGVAVLAFELPRAERVRLSVFDVQGREVAVLADGPIAAGVHQARLDAGSLRAGLYFVRLRTPGADLRRRALIVH